MTDEQLKREIINANSVLYKAKQRGASEETIAANQARVDAAKAEKAGTQSAGRRLFRQKNRSRRAGVAGKQRPYHGRRDRPEHMEQPV